MKILTLGGATQDVFIHCQDAQTVELGDVHAQKSFLLLQEGTKIEIDTIRYSIGGGATNSAVSFKRLGFEVSCFFKIGADSQGMAILQALKQEGVSIDYCIIDQNEQTGISYIIPSRHGDRTVLAFRGANATILKHEFSLDSFVGYSHAYITSLSGVSSQLLLPVVQQAKKDGVIIVNNPGINQLSGGISLYRQSLPFIDILILNRDEAERLMASLLDCQDDIQEFLEFSVPSYSYQCNAKPSLLHKLFTCKNMQINIVHFFKALSSYGPHIIVVTNGAEGVYVYSESTVYFHPGWHANILSTLGAGDAFGSAFVAGLVLFSSVEQAIRAGIINSLSVITRIDAKEGLLDRIALDQALKNLDNSLLYILKLI